MGFCFWLCVGSLISGGSMPSHSDFFFFMYYLFGNNRNREIKEAFIYSFASLSLSMWIYFNKTFLPGPVCLIACHSVHCVFLSEIKLLSTQTNLNSTFKNIINFVG